MNVFDTHAKIIAIMPATSGALSTSPTQPSSKKLIPRSLKVSSGPIRFFSSTQPTNWLAASKKSRKAASSITPFQIFSRATPSTGINSTPLVWALLAKDFVVTSGTGSGKSLTYIASIFHRLLTEPKDKGVAAVIVYPMNALINSQTNEFNVYKKNYENATGQTFPITVGQYTGQEKSGPRAQMQENPPHILLTNYMMLELLLTRVQERKIRDAIYDNLRFLVFDELHTYRGRQGTDVAMLIRRIRAQCKQEVVCIGTSATMVSVGTLEAQSEEVAKVATTMFGKPFTSAQIVNERLTRSLDFEGQLPDQQALAQAISGGIDVTAPEAELRSNPVAVWLENRIALEEKEDHLVRRKPLQIGEVVSALAEDSGQSRSNLQRDACQSSAVDQLPSTRL